MQVNDFNEWRHRYPTLTFKEMARFYRQLAADHPEQHHFDDVAVLKFFSELDGRRRYDVIELGGWDGELAALVLRDSPAIRSWRNYEISNVESVCTDKRFKQVRMTRYLWETRARADVLVASHVLEHLSREHLSACLSWAYRAGVQRIYTDMPPCSGGHDNTTASHILAATDEWIVKLFANHLYKLDWSCPGKDGTSTVRAFSRE